MANSQQRRDKTTQQFAPSGAGDGLSTTRLRAASTYGTSSAAVTDVQKTGFGLPKDPTHLVGHWPNTGETPDESVSRDLDRWGRMSEKERTDYMSGYAGSRAKQLRDGTVHSRAETPNVTSQASLDGYRQSLSVAHFEKAMATDYGVSNGYRPNRMGEELRVVVASQPDRHQTRVPLRQVKNLPDQIGGRKAYVGEVGETPGGGPLGGSWYVQNGNGEVHPSEFVSVGDRVVFGAEHFQKTDGTWKLA